MKSTLCAIVGLAISSISSHAALVIDNIGNGTQGFADSLSGPTATGSFGFGTFEDREVAFSFTTGSVPTFLDDLTFSMNIGKAILDPIQIVLSTGANAPGGTNPVVLGSVAPAPSPTAQLLTLTPTVPPALLASTTYWLHITVPVGEALYSVRSSDGATLASGWSLGTTWSKTPSTSWTEGNTALGGDIRMNVSPIPEPSIASLFGSIGVLLLMRRRR